MELKSNIDVNEKKLTAEDILKYGKHEEIEFLLENIYDSRYNINNSLRIIANGSPRSEELFNIIKKYIDSINAERIKEGKEINDTIFPYTTVNELNIFKNNNTAILELAKNVALYGGTKSGKLGFDLGRIIRSANPL